MDQVNDEDLGGLIDPSFDFSAYLADTSDIPLGVLVESPTKATAEFQLNHELTFEEFCELDFNIPQSIQYSPLEKSLPGGVTLFDRSPIRTPKLVIPFTATVTHEDDIYLNKTINSFKSPDIPLSVIDSLKYPFDDELQSSLEKAVKQQQNKETESQNGEFEAALQQTLEKELDPQTQEPAHQTWSGLDAPDKVVDENFGPTVKRGKSRRSQNRLNFDPSKYYQSLPAKPASWGPRTNNGQHLFQYTDKGELLPQLLFTKEQVVHFIQHHPLNYINGSLVPDAKNSGLILWIQTVPADSAKRYPNSVSAKCRFIDCPESHNTILKGDFRVAFDEQSSQHPKVDPFHCAGYAHLWCMEKFLDFPQLCRTFNVQPDTRAFPEGRNKMAITRDHLSMLDIVEHYIQRFSWESGVSRPPYEFRYYLTRKLTKCHLKMQPVQKQTDRDNRASNSSIDVTLNDLELYVRNRAIRNTEKKASNTSTTRSRKRKVANLEDCDDGVLDNDILSRNVASSVPKRAKYIE